MVDGPAYDQNQIIRTLELLEVGSTAELRVLNTEPHRGTVSGYFDDFANMGYAAMQWSGKAAGVYLTLNPVVRDLRARANNRAKPYSRRTTDDEEVVRRRWLLIDCDPVRPAGISSNEMEHEAALARAADVRNYLHARGLPESLLCDSGNGGHVLLKMEGPNDPEHRDQAKALLAHLAGRFDDQQVRIDQTTFNAARLNRFYGTLACKGDEVPELGRVYRLARILEE
jgi:hypothetical protein